MKYLIPNYNSVIRRMLNRKSKKKTRFPNFRTWCRLKMYDDSWINKIQKL